MEKIMHVIINEGDKMISKSGEKILKKNQVHFSKKMRQ